VSAPVAEARELVQVYKVGRGLFREPAQLYAVSGISFSIEPGRTLAVVGESGSGKSTLARMVTLIEPPTSGALTLDGIDALSPPAGERTRLRRTVQLVFQNPYGSLNPRKKVGSILEEPLAINTDLPRGERTALARAMMAKVGLRPEHYARYPHMFSGGQRQRIAIARALMLSPKLLVADEPVSALDVSIQAQVLNLLADLQNDLGLAYLFISHDLGVVRHIAHVPRPCRRAGREGAHLRPRAASLHAGAPCLDAGHHGRRAQAHRAEGRAALPPRPAERLRVLDPVPLRDRALQGRASAASAARWAARRLPLRRAVPGRSSGLSGRVNAPLRPGSAVHSRVTLPWEFPCSNTWIGGVFPGRFDQE
jgi:ABC-type oligopeptide transport system ATPase subunit